MQHIDEKTSKRGWELEIVCEDRGYLKQVILAIPNYVKFDINKIDTKQGERCTVLIWGIWIHSLYDFTKSLNEIEGLK